MYTPLAFPRARGLRGLPDALIEAHLRLYAGYVRAANALVDAPPEARRRLAFEIDGMRLHELYFEQLSPAGDAPAPYDGWREEFAAMGRLRGVGWVLTSQDPETGRLVTHWVDQHHDGHLAGFAPIVVMDLWEHAYTGMERAAYVDAFLANLDGAVIARRITAAGAGGGRRPA